eukprot:891185-Amphidinium_carterae.1
MPSNLHANAGTSHVGLLQYAAKLRQDEAQRLLGKSRVHRAESPQNPYRAKAVIGPVSPSSTPQVKPQRWHHSTKCVVPCFALVLEPCCLDSEPPERLCTRTARRKQLWKDVDAEC